MTDLLRQKDKDVSSEPQCQYFVVRKKRLCRMTVKPGHQYCGEHEPQPTTAEGQEDSRIPCPNDPKHTCFLSKLEKHLLICNARPTEQPPYIIHNINSPTETDECVRKPLSQLSKDTIMAVIEKVNTLYDRHVKGQIVTEPDHPIHSAVLEEFSDCHRTESSLRHLRQVSSLLWLIEREGLVEDHTCYVELGAGKGQMSYYLCGAWCAEGGGSTTLLVDRAALRHKRDNKLRAGALRLRADLAHLALARVPAVADCRALVALAKHLCGVATDYALRCVAGEGARQKARGLALATCCHHRCERAPYVGGRHLQELGITGDDLNVMLGIVSWATCGDGRSRGAGGAAGAGGAGRPEAGGEGRAEAGGEGRAEAGGEGRAEAGGEGRAEAGGEGRAEAGGEGRAEAGGEGRAEAGGEGRAEAGGEGRAEAGGEGRAEAGGEGRAEAGGEGRVEAGGEGRAEAGGEGRAEAGGEGRAEAGVEGRAEAGRRAKQLLDWGRVLFLRERGFDARLCHFVPRAVSPENVCIVARKYR